MMPLFLLLLCLGQALDPAPPDWQRDWDAGRRHEALAALTEATAADPCLRPLLAARLMDLHQYAAALEQALAAGDPGRPLAGACLYLLGQHERALPYLDPDDPLAALMRVDALEMLGRHAQAWDALRAAERLLGDDVPELLSVRGRLAAQDGDDEQAVQAFRAALAGDPLALSALFGLGRALLRSGALDEGSAVLAEHRRLVPMLDAHDAALRAIDLGPLHAPNHALLGDTERALGRLPRADAAYRRAGQLARDEERVPVALRHARLLADDLHDVDAAVALLDAVGQQTGDARAAVRAGDLLARTGRKLEAATRYRSALALRPGDGQISARLEHATDGAER